jgi:BMFP domain-containing protein YqiC
MPDFKTIANFRRSNGKATRKVCTEFVGLCRKLDLFNQALVAIDGSKFKASNNRDKNFTPAKMKRRLEEIERSNGRYFSRLDLVDREEPSADMQSGKLQEKIDSLKEEMKHLKTLETKMLATPDKQRVMSIMGVESLIEP